MFIILIHGFFGPNNIQVFSMKKNLFFASLAAAALCFVSCANEPAFEQTEEVGPYTVSLIESNVWHVEDCNSERPHGLSIKPDGGYDFNGCTDMYIIKGSKKALLIDLSNKITWADNADESLRKIVYDRIGKKDLVITVTHNHGDHTGMYPAFKDEPNVKFHLPVNDFKDDAMFVEKTLWQVDEILDLGGMKVQGVQVEGHTPGSMIFFLLGHNLAFSGDAIGSGTGVWLFQKDAMAQYSAAIERLVKYIQDPKNGIDPKSFVIHGGHTYQNSGFVLGYQTVLDAKTLNDKIAEGTAEWTPYQTQNPYLDATFKYGEGLVVWNVADSEAYAAEQ